MKIRETLLQRTRSRYPELKSHVDLWLDHIPIDKRDKLLRRLQVPPSDLPGFLGAFFELQLHEMLKRASCQFCYEPDGPVDFCIFDDAERFFLEATVCGAEHRPYRLDSNIAHFFDSLKRHLPPMTLDLWLEIGGNTDQRLSNKEIERFSEQCRQLLDTYDAGWTLPMPKLPDIPGLLANKRTAVELANNDWQVRACVAPVPTPDRAGDVIRWPGLAKGAFDQIRKSIKKKLRNWKSADGGRGHFLIAINIVHPHAVQGDLERAVFGPKWRAKLNAPSTFVRDLTAANGVIGCGENLPDTQSSSHIRLYQNGIKPVPSFLQHLKYEKRLGALLGI